MPQITADRELSEPSSTQTTDSAETADPRRTADPHRTRRSTQNPQIHADDTQKPFGAAVALVVPQGVLSVSVRNSECVEAAGAVEEKPFHKRLGRPKSGRPTGFHNALLYSRDRVGDVRSPVDTFAETAADLGAVVRRAERRASSGAGVASVARLRANGSGDIGTAAAPGLVSQSRRPRPLCATKGGRAGRAIDSWIASRATAWDQRLRNELIRLHQLRFSLATSHKVLVRNNQSRLLVRWWRRRAPNRYTRPIPCDRVQIDVGKIAPRLYHYAAIDDCTRYRVLGLYPRATATHAVAFLECVVEEMPFAIQRIQTDRAASSLRCASSSG